MGDDNPLILGNAWSVNRLIDLVARGEPDTRIGHLLGVPITISSVVPDNEIWMRSSDGRVTKMRLDTASETRDERGG